MKYNARKTSNGDYAVFTGNSYFSNTVTSDLNEAKKTALMLSAQWYYEQAEKAFAQADKEGLLDKYETHLGEWLC